MEKYIYEKHIGTGETYVRAHPVLDASKWPDLKMPAAGAASCGWRTAKISRDDPAASHPTPAFTASRYASLTSESGPQKYTCSHPQLLQLFCASSNTQTEFLRHSKVIPRLSFLSLFFSLHHGCCDRRLIGTQFALTQPVSGPISIRVMDRKV